LRAGGKDDAGTVVKGIKGLLGEVFKNVLTKARKKESQNIKRGLGGKATAEGEKGGGGIPRRRKNHKIKGESLNC